MQLTFRNNKLQKLAEQGKQRTKTLGPECAKKFQQRITELMAAKCLEDLRHHYPARIHELSGNLKGSLSADLKHPLRLIFEPSGTPPKKPDGGLDWSAVTEIEITDILDTHG
jgi:plasmid maintenance system killer protein